MTELFHPWNLRNPRRYRAGLGRLKVCHRMQYCPTGQVEARLTGRRLKVLFPAMNSAAKAKRLGYRQGEAPALRVQENGVTAYVVEAKAYETMQKRLQLLEGLARGEKAIAEGRVVSHSRAKRRMARWLMN